LGKEAKKKREEGKGREGWYDMDMESGCFLSLREMNEGCKNCLEVRSGGFWAFGF